MKSYNNATSTVGYIEISVLFQFFVVSIIDPEVEPTGCGIWLKVQAIL